MRKLQPLNTLVLVKPDLVGEQKVGGLYLPESSLGKPNVGTVVEVPSAGVSGVAVGDRVLYKKDAGEEVGSGNDLYILLEAADLLAKYVETDAIPA